MLQQLAAGHVALMRRFIEDKKPTYELPTWTPIVALVDLAIFIPLLLFVGYTLGALVPTLATVEDPNPPPYEPVALNEDEAARAGDPTSAPLFSGMPVTSSLRATRRLLSSVAGWQSYFRGIICALAIGVADWFFLVLLSTVVPVGKIDTGFGLSRSILPIGSLIASLALVQLRTAWTHIVISTPSSLPFYRRLPPFKKTFEATCFPVFAVWAAGSVAGIVPALIQSALGLEITKPSNPGGDGAQQPPHFAAGDLWKILVVAVVSISLLVLVVVPTNVALVRVQASLLPPEEHTIVPFDRSFGGRLEPNIVGGKGFISMKEALVSFGRANWIRIYKVYGKVIAVTLATYILIGVVVGFEAAIVMTNAKQKN